VDSRQAIASYEQEVADLAERAEEAKAKIKELAGTASSSDGAVTVTVNAGGALQNLTFGPRAEEMPRERLAATIVATAKRAQTQAAQQITGIMAPLVGEDSDAMRFVQEHIPAPEVPDEPGEPAAPGDQVPLNEEDEDFGIGNVTRRGDW
jgi:DNA-binding protein YbaB